MWLQAQDIVLRARHIPGCLNVIIADRLSRPNQLILTVESKFRDCHFPVLGNSKGGHVCRCPQHPPTSVHDSDSGASSTGGGCSVSGLTGEINVHVSAIFSAQQGHPGSRSNTDSSFVAVTAVVSTPTSTLCGSTTVLSIPPRSTVSAESGIHLGLKVIPFARIEALSDITRQQDFQTRSLGLPQHLGDPQPIASTTTGGFASLTGPQLLK